MKTVYLFRHSTPDKHSTLQNEHIPLSPEGKAFAKQFVDKLPVTASIPVFSSPFVRAKQTADTFSLDVITDARLIERKVGNKDTFTKDLWASQYTNPDAKNTGGESFRMVQRRMHQFMDDLLAKMDDGESAIVVSHAAAICAYLQQYCEIQVTDVDTKRRRIVFLNQTILDGTIKTPSCFVLTFDKDLTAVSYIA